MGLQVWLGKSASGPSAVALNSPAEPARATGLEREAVSVAGKLRHNETDVEEMSLWIYEPLSLSLCDGKSLWGRERDTEKGRDRV